MKKYSLLKAPQKAQSDGEKDSKVSVPHDQQFLSVFANFLVDIFRVFIAIAVFRYLFVNSIINFKYIKCSLYTVDKAMTDNYKCSESKFNLIYSIVNVIRFLISLIISIIMIFVYTAAGPGAIGYRNLENTLKIEHVTELYSFKGAAGSLFVESINYSFVMICLIFTKNNVDEDSLISGDTILNDLGWVNALFIVYIFIRIIHCFYFFREKMNIEGLSVLSNIDTYKTNLIFSSQNIKSGNNITKILNIIQCTLTALITVIILALTIFMFVFSAKFDIRGGDSIFVLIMTIIYTILSLIFLAYQIINKDYGLSNSFKMAFIHSLGFWNCSAIYNDKAMELLESNSGPDSSTIAIVVTVVIPTVFILINLIVAAINTFLIHLREKTLSSKNKKNRCEKMFFPIITFLIVTASYLTFLLVMEDIFYGFNDNTFSYVVEWCKESADNNAVQQAYTAFKNGDSTVKWSEHIFKIVNLDVTIIAIVLFFLLIFSRKFISSRKLSDIFFYVIIYCVLIILLEDGYISGIFKTFVNGPATVIPNQHTIKNEFKVREFLIKVFVLFNLMLDLVDESVPTNFGDGDSDLSESPTVARSKGFNNGLFIIYIIVPFLLNMLYTSNSGEGTYWLRVKGKKFEGSEYEPGFYRERGECLGEYPVGLSEAIENFIKKGGSLNDDVQFDYFENHEERVGIIVFIQIMVGFLMILPYLRFQFCKNIIFHIILILVNILLFIRICSIFTIVSMYLSNLPNLFYEIYKTKAFESIITASLVIIFLCIYSLINEIAPLSVAIMNADEKARL